MGDQGSRPESKAGHGPYSRRGARKPIHLPQDFFQLTFQCLKFVQTITALGSNSNLNFLSLLTFSLPHPPPSARALRRYRRPHPVRCRRPRPRAPPRGRALPSPAPPRGRAPPPPAPLCAASPPLLRAALLRAPPAPALEKKTPRSPEKGALFNFQF